MTVASPELELSAKLHDLHQLLYMRGGIRPVNAAVDELAKLLLMRLACHRLPELIIAGHKLKDLTDPDFAASESGTEPWKEAFSAVIALDELRGRLPDGSTQPVWPLDEPFRLSRVDVLTEALRVLSHVEFGATTSSSLDPIGVAFDTFLHGKYDHAGGLGTYLTPATVAKTMAEVGFELVDPLSDGLVGDPCAGTGRFLAAIVAKAAERISGEKLTTWISENVVGCDQSANSVAMARVNMLSYGAQHPHVFTVEDSITDQHLDEWRGQFRLILTNPPFGDGKYDDAEGIRRTDTLLRASRGRPKIDPAIAFVARCIDLLAEGGVAGIVLPDGVLNGSALQEALVPKAALIQAAHVEGVISLPTATFAPAGTVAKTSVLFLRKAGVPSRSVFLARANHVGYVMKSGAAVADPDGDDLPEISSAVRSLLSSGVESSPLVAECQRDELRSLDASSVDAAAVLARDHLVHLGGKPFSDLLKPVKAKRSQLRDDIPFVSVLHVDDLGSVVWHEAESYQPTTPGKLASAGDILISLLNPSKFRATVVPERYAVVQVSAEFGVFKATEDAYASLALLQHPSVRAQLAPLGTGTSSSRRRISPEDVLGVVCPPYDSAWLARTGAAIKAALDQRDAAALVLFQSFFAV